MSESEGRRLPRPQEPSDLRTSNIKIILRTYGRFPAIAPTPFTHGTSSRTETLLARLALRHRPAVFARHRQAGNQTGFDRITAGDNQDRHATRPRRADFRDNPQLLFRRTAASPQTAMREREIAEDLGVTHQRVRQLVIKLHAQGRVSFGDPETPFWIVMRAGDKTRLLSRDQERVLSAIPREYATNATKIRLAVRMPETKVRQILERLIIGRLVEAFEGWRGDRVYRITAAGLKHPQRGQVSRHAQAARPPVESDRVRKVLSAISDSGVLRIRDLTDVLRIPRESMNALMQYLKRKLW